MNTKNPESNKLTEFPFPLSEAPEKQRYLTWLRNHSNYMATRGLQDYFRMAGVLLRGIVLNFLIFLSLLLVISMVVALLYDQQIRTLPSWEDLPPKKVKSIADKLRNPGRPIDQFVVQQLSEQTRQALASKKDSNLRQLRAYLVEDFRKIVSHSAITFELQYYADKTLLLHQMAALKNKPNLDTNEDEFIYLLDKQQSNDFDGLEKGNLFTPDFVARINTYPVSMLPEFKERLQEDNLSEQENDGEGMEIQWFEDTCKNCRHQSRKNIDYAYLADAYPKSPSLLLMPAPYTLTVSAVLFTLLLIVLSPIALILKDIAGHRKSLQRAGSGGSVKSRDKFERFFGWVLLLIASLALFESIPLLVDQYHLFHTNPQVNWNSIFASVASVSMIVVGVAGKILQMLGGFKQKLMIGVVGLLGILPPLWVVLYTTEYLVYSEPMKIDLWSFQMFMLPALFSLVVIVCLAIGSFTRSFTLTEWLRVLVLATAAPIAAALIVVLVDEIFREFGRPEIGIVAVIAAELWLFCRFLVDVNSTSIHGLYRDRLASAYLVGVDTNDDINIEKDISLSEIGWYAAGSTAPYHLINAAINLQGSRDMSIRDRNSDFFIFSKRYIGGSRTGYCRTTTMEQIQPNMSLATAMAISAAAASPNMGRTTNPALVALMVLFNIRLGYWLPNPGLLEYKLSQRRGLLAAIQKAGLFIWNKVTGSSTKSTTTQKPPGFTFEEVFKHELQDIKQRWQNVYPNAGEREPNRLQSTNKPSADLMLIGLAFSGGGIRSATFNLGITQALHKWGIFKHVDYLSTVSGGGYLGSSISTLMRGNIVSDLDGKVKLDQAGKNIIVQCVEESREQCSYPFSWYDQPAVKNGDTVKQGQTLMHHHKPHVSNINGVAVCDKNSATVTVKDEHEHCETNTYTRFDQIRVKNGAEVKKGRELIKPHNTFLDRFRWRVKPSNLVREILMKLDESHKWVNLSDGGHIENLAGMELLRRRCKLIIIGDGEADPKLAFNGLANLIRFARIDLGVNIDINPDPIRVDNSKNAVKEGKDNISTRHWALGTITYPADADHKEEKGRLLYLKSSYTDDEDEVIKEYRLRNPSFPHESTADQFFSEEQFECYRSLGQHIAETTIKETFPQLSLSGSELKFSNLKDWMEMTIKEQEEVRSLSQEQSRTGRTSTMAAFETTDSPS